MDDLPLKRLCRWLLLLIVPPFGSASVFISLPRPLSRSLARHRTRKFRISHNPVGAQLVWVSDDPIDITLDRQPRPSIYLSTATPRPSLLSQTTCPQLDPLRRHPRARSPLPIDNNKLLVVVPA
ncbi:hypothetical protein HD553DRAFT_164062 [Filobasidium floriforme]|uniref:uncharacterized protein n=1 Tax=Filobasidium floriforme TaxID=5210 RepID=UPI001E8DE865|nr:uncharacterized protein HD553DRAFT_164062 [Filobasidium floriforme]KAH8089328.1 hypothetical protein HD553DRAFT_164062 [Filobasidium floriforme]